MPFLTVLDHEAGEIVIHEYSSSVEDIEKHAKEVFDIDLDRYHWLTTDKLKINIQHEGDISIKS